MATVIRPEISEKNKYYIDKHRYYELKHFCLQYPVWKKEIVNIYDMTPSSNLEYLGSSNLPNDPTYNLVATKMYYETKIKMIEDIAKQADDFLYKYILKAVTEGLSYTYLKSRLNIPCGRDTYYDRYRRFFWLLNKHRK